MMPDPCSTHGYDKELQTSVRKAGRREDLRTQRGGGKVSQIVKLDVRWIGNRQLPSSTDLFLMKPSSMHIVCEDLWLLVSVWGRGMSQN